MPNEIDALRAQLASLEHRVSELTAAPLPLTRVDIDRALYGINQTPTGKKLLTSGGLIVPVTTSARSDSEVADNTVSMYTSGSTKVLQARDGPNAAWRNVILNASGIADHTVASHSDTTATGPETEALTNGSDGDGLHGHTNHGVTHNAAHTAASHSDQGATGAELETLTDGSETTLHSHAAAVTLSALVGDIRDNRALMMFNDFGSGQYNPPNNTEVGLGVMLFRDGSGSAGSLGSQDSGGYNLIKSGTTSNSQCIYRTNAGFAKPEDNPYWASKHIFDGAEAAIKAQGCGFMLTNVMSSLTSTTLNKAVFRQVTTGNLFAVTGNASTEETTDLGTDELTV